jgi:Nickel/cobalt transporter regulator
MPRGRYIEVSIAQMRRDVSVASPGLPAIRARLGGLEIPPVGCEWVRDGDDALLIDTNTGAILQVEYGAFSEPAGVIARLSCRAITYSRIGAVRQ